MAIYFLSDLHLRDSESAATLRFCSFLNHEVKVSDTLILGGDVFDLFVGNKQVFLDRFSNILRALESLGRSGTNILYLEGNHDFHLEAAFQEMPGVRVFRGSYSAEIEGVKVCVSHGDEIDREDYGYRFLRFITRAWLFQIFLRIMPGAWLAALGNWSSDKSRKYNGVERQNTAAVDRTKRLFREFAAAQVSAGVRFVFLGHSHIRDHECFPGGAEYVNLGYSSQELLYARYSPPGEGLQLLRYTAVN